MLDIYINYWQYINTKMAHSKKSLTLFSANLKEKESHGMANV